VRSEEGDKKDNFQSIEDEVQEEEYSKKEKVTTLIACAIKKGRGGCSRSMGEILDTGESSRSGIREERGGENQNRPGESGEIMIYIWCLKRMQVTRGLERREAPTGNA